MKKAIIPILSIIAMSVSFGADEITQITLTTTDSDFIVGDGTGTAENPQICTYGSSNGYNGAVMAGSSIKGEITVLENTVLYMYDQRVVGSGFSELKFSGEGKITHENWTDSQGIIGINSKNSKMIFDVDYTYTHLANTTYLMIDGSSNAGSTDTIQFNKGVSVLNDTIQVRKNINLVFGDGTTTATGNVSNIAFENTTTNKVTINKNYTLNIQSTDGLVYNSNYIVNGKLAYNGVFGSDNGTRNINITVNKDGTLNATSKVVVSKGVTLTLAGGTVYAKNGTTNQGIGIAGGKIIFEGNSTITTGWFDASSGELVFKANATVSGSTFVGMTNDFKITVEGNGASFNTVKLKEGMGSKTLTIDLGANSFQMNKLLAGNDEDTGALSGDETLTVDFLTTYDDSTDTYSDWTINSFKLTSQDANYLNKVVGDGSLIFKLNHEVVDFTFTDDKENGGVFINVATVPEPAEWAMIFGAIALGFVAYRRRK